MKTRTSYLLLLAILPLVAGVAVGATVSMVEAQQKMSTEGGVTEPRVGPRTPKNFGSSTGGIVCGDRLCDEFAHFASGFDIEEFHVIATGGDEPSYTPQASLISIDRFRPSSAREDITYSIMYSITAGDTDLMGVTVKAESDLEGVVQELGGITAGKTQRNVLRMKAIDPDSINGGIVGFELAPPTYNPQDPRTPQEICPDC